MSTKDIRTHHVHTVCDVCGRGLLRGERADVFVDGGARRLVCELCKTRALHEGWVREGSLPDGDPSMIGADRRRSLLGRLRGRRAGTADRRAEGSGEFDPLDLGAVPGVGDDAFDPEPGGIVVHPADVAVIDEQAPAGEWWDGHPESAPAPIVSARRAIRGDRNRTSRLVRAVPTSEDQKVASAIDIFNRSEHPRTVAGVARSLGAPAVSIAPDLDRQSLVWVVVAWELCWYRYEIDLADDGAGIRLDSRGYELDQLSDRERAVNAAADEVGQLRVP